MCDSSDFIYDCFFIENARKQASARLLSKLVRMRVCIELFLTVDLFEEDACFPRNMFLETDVFNMLTF